MEETNVSDSPLKKENNIRGDTGLDEDKLGSVDILSNLKKIALEQDR